ncbi:hypothetical protein [Nostoc sp. 'Peltigera malacea cyanobiont' DB3992]|nr:hypothetical protein [Nostoc sp. 'Peltigera malacea cyanobiont' DB3992]
MLRSFMLPLVRGFLFVERSQRSAACLGTSIPGCSTVTQRQTPARE